MYWHIFVAFMVGLPRPLGVKTQFYQAVAHLYMGGVITVYYLYREPLWLWILVTLSVLEIVCFVYFKFLDKPKIEITHIGGIPIDDFEVDDIGYKRTEPEIDG